MYSSNKTFKIAIIISLLLHGVILFVLNWNFKPSLIDEFQSMPALSISLTRPFFKSLPERSELPENKDNGKTMEDVREEKKPAEPVPKERPVETVSEEIASVEEIASSEEAVSIDRDISENSISPVASSANSVETAVPSPETGAYSGEKLEDLDFSGAARMPAPAYPSQAKKMEWEGNVTVSFVINKKGKVESLELEESSGFELLDKTVINTVKKGWRFPRRDDPVRVWKTFSFRLI